MSSKTNPSIISLQAIQSIQQYLSQFAATDDFESKIESAFGTKIGAAAIRQQWLSGDFSLIPEIRVLSNGELGTVNGDYAASLDEILVSSDFLAQHQNDVPAVAELLLEEIGHKLDTVLNGSVDSPGDEGAIFRLLATGYNLSAETLAGLKTQYDHKVITVNEQSVAVETQDFTGTFGNDTLVGTGGDDKFFPLAGADNIDGRAGTDYLGLADFTNTAATTTINYTTLTNGTITGGSNNGTTFQNIEVLSLNYGNSVNNYINVSAASGGNEINITSTGNDTIIGGAGNDKIYGGNGADKLSGGAGNDTYSFGTFAGGTVIDDSSGMDDGLFLDRTLTTKEISRNGTTLLIDLNRDSIFDPAMDLSINNYFANLTGSVRGNGFIEYLSGLSIPEALNLSTRNDFNRDGKSDILWRNNDGSVATWQINAYAITPRSVGKLTPDWTVAGTGDFNGDFYADMLLSNTDGSVATWQIRQPNGTAITSNIIGSITPDWKIAGIGDFNGDGKSDLLFQNTNGSIAEWQMNGSTVVATAIVGTPTSDWQVAGTGDFNGDGKSDLLLLNNDGRIAEWQMNGMAVSAASIIGAVTPDWKISATGDFNGDGKADLLFRNTNGDVAEWQMNSSTVTSTSIVGTATADWKIAGTGDYNGDGKADILWRNDLGGVAEWQMDGSTVLSAGATSITSAASSWNIAAPIG